MFILLAAVAAAGAQPQPKPIAHPGTWITAADYPAAAIMAGESGTVGFTLGVDEQGRTVQCTITQPSNSAVLDSTTCRLMALRARFEPARDAKGKAIPSTFQSRMRWVLPAFRPPIPGLLVTTVELSPDGKVEKCSTEATDAVPQPARDLACRNVQSGVEASFLKAHAATYKRLRSATGISVGDRKFAVDGSPWGTLILRRAHLMEFGPKGQPLRCTVTASVGGNLADDPCVRLRKVVALPAASGEKPAHVASFETAVFGENR